MKTKSQAAAPCQMLLLDLQPLGVQLKMVFTAILTFKNLTSIS